MYCASLQASCLCSILFVWRQPLRGLLARGQRRDYPMNRGMQHSTERCGQSWETPPANLNTVLHEQCPKCDKYSHLYKVLEPLRFWQCCCGHRFSTPKEDKNRILPFSRTRWPQRLYQGHLEQGEKWCAECNRWLPLKDFSHNEHKSLQKATYCRTCSTVRDRDYQAGYYLDNKSRLATGKRASALASYRRRNQ